MAAAAAIYIFCILHVASGKVTYPVFTPAMLVTEKLEVISVLLFLVKISSSSLEPVEMTVAILVAAAGLPVLVRPVKKKYHGFNFIMASIQTSALYHLAG